MVSRSLLDSHHNLFLFSKNQSPNLWPTYTNILICYRCICYFFDSPFSLNQLMMEFLHMMLYVHIDLENPVVYMQPINILASYIVAIYVATYVYVHTSHNFLTFKANAFGWHFSNLLGRYNNSFFLSVPVNDENSHFFVCHSEWHPTTLYLLQKFFYRSSL